MDFGIIALTVTLLLGVLSAVFGTRYKISLKKFDQVVDLVNTIQEAAEDKKITEEEVVEIIKKGKVLLGLPEKTGR